MTQSELGKLALQLIAAYGENAWPFALAHGVIIAFLVFSIRTLLHETHGLTAWQPGDEGRSMAANILASFVRDSRRLGERGFVVPITDYSDRLDSQIENIVDEIGERTNMLLIVGIAGTLFGIFEFAYRTQNLQAESDRLGRMTGILADSIAKAFPVGFVGLMLMLIFQLALAVPISRLHQASSDATRRALEHRGEVSQTLADAIAHSIASSIAQSMRPVSTLGETVSKHLQPIVVELGNRLEDSLSLVRKQFNAIDQGTAQFLSATNNLQKSASTMTTTADELRKVLKMAPSVLSKTAELQEIQHQALEQIQGAFTRDLQVAEHVTNTLDRVTTSIAALPEQLVEQTVAAVGAAFDTVATQSVESWGKLSESLRAELQTETTILVKETREEIQSVQQQVAAAANEWKRLATQSETLISAPLARALGEIDRSTGTVADKFIAVAGDLQSIEAKLATLPDDLVRQTGAAIGPAFENVANVSIGTWDELVKTVVNRLQSEFTNYVTRSFDEVARATVQMRAASEEMQRVAENTVAFLTEPVKTAVETARAEAAGALANLDEFIRQAYPALKSDMDRFATELRTATELLATTGERIRSMPTETRNKGQDEVVAALRDIREQLERMQPKPIQWNRLLPHKWFD